MSRPGKVSPEKATLLDILTDGFEGGQGALESEGGWRERKLPMPSESSAKKKLLEILAEATRWKGHGDLRGSPEEGWQGAKWPDLEIWWKGRGILILVRDPEFDRWWHQPETWDGDPMDEVSDLCWAGRS